MLKFLLNFFEMFCPIQYELNGRDIDWSGSLFSIFMDLFVIAFIIFVINLIREETIHNKGIRKGEIYKKEFRQEYTQQGIVPIPFERHFDAEYIIYIKNEGASNYWNVNEETYNNLKVGDTFDYNQYLRGDVLQENLTNNEIQTKTNINQEYICSKLKIIGNKLLKNSYKNKWTLENPTYGYCYIVSEAIYHFTNGDYIPQCINLGKDIGVNWYLKDKNSNKIIDFTSNQFDFKIDYSKGIGKGFMKGCISTTKGFISKRGYEMAKVLELN